MIDKRFIEFKANSYKEEPEELQLAAGPSQTMTDAGPTRIELTGMATPDKTPRVGRAGVPYQAPSMRDITEPAKAMADMGAAAVKGATQGFIGLPGDIEGIGRLILGKMGVNVDEATKLPTTEDVKTWLDKNLGAVGDGQNPYESVGEVLAPSGQVKAAKAVAKGAKALAPKAAEMVMDVTEKTGMPVKGLGIVEKSLTSKGAKLTPDIEVSAAGDIKKPAFKKWFADSKVVDDKGQPIVMYHGTTRNFESFDPNAPSPESNPIGAMFFTDDPSFAEQFRGTSGNIMPVYVSAKNPFDFENAEHRSALIDLLMQKVGIYRNAPDQESMRKVLDADIEKKDGTANWGVIEMKESIESLKQLGFDSFYVREGGRKNLGVFDPSKIKSVFNKGTWNPEDPRILHGAGGVAIGSGASTMDKSQQEPK
jgi:hypothetical protein